MSSLPSYFSSLPSYFAASVTVVASLLQLASPGLATGDGEQTDRPSEACTRSINAIGASLRHTEKALPDGRLEYQFVIRSNGVDYSVTCDAATGVVGEVAPRTATTEAPL